MAKLLDLPDELLRCVLSGISSSSSSFAAHLAAFSPSHPVQPWTQPHLCARRCLWSHNNLASKAMAEGPPRKHLGTHQRALAKGLSASALDARRHRTHSRCWRNSTVDGDGRQSSHLSAVHSLFRLSMEGQRRQLLGEAHSSEKSTGAGIHGPQRVPTFRVAQVRRADR